MKNIKKKLKVKLKKAIDNRLDLDSNKIINKIRDFEIISFDVFDTLLKRDVFEPKEIFRLVEIEYNNIIEKERAKLSNFVENRIQAEKKAQEKNLLLNNYEEITFDEIYEEITTINEIEKSILKQLELELEYKYSTVNTIINEVFQWCRKNNKTIIIISDMYLSKEYIEKLLKKSNYTGYSKIYVSSEFKTKKSTGNLFKSVLNDLKVNPNKIIHIGDNIKGDFLGARKNKIRSILIPTNYRVLTFTNETNDSLNNDYLNIKQFINNHYPLYEDLYFKFGYELLGPLLYGFSEWLYIELKKGKFEKVYFLARDGYLLKKVFEILNIDNTLDLRYLYISRRSIKVPLLHQMENVVEMITLAVNKRMFTLKDFLICCGIEDNKYVSRFNLNLDEQLTIKSLTTNNKYKDFLNQLIKDIQANSNTEFENLYGYLKQEEMVGKFAVVDIGWAGTIQNLLHLVLPKADFTGYYMGVKSIEKDINLGKKKGYIFEPKKNKLFSDEFSFFVGPFELLFLATEGSTKKYTLEKKRYKPILSSYEQSNLVEVQKIQNIQNGALKFVNDYKELNFFKEGVDSEIYYSDFRRFFLNPSLSETKLFSDFSFLDGEIIYIAKPKSLFNYLLNPKSFIFDLSNSTWKVAFLKRLLKVNLPYRKILIYMKKFQ